MWKEKPEKNGSRQLGEVNPSLTSSSFTQSRLLKVPLDFPCLLGGSKHLLDLDQMELVFISCLNRWSLLSEENLSLPAAQVGWSAMPFKRGLRTRRWLAVALWQGSFLWAAVSPSIKIKRLGTSLVVQGLRIHSPMPGTWVQYWGQGDSTCCRATKPTRHNYGGCAL